MSCCELLNISAAERTRRLIVLGASGSVGGSTIQFLEAMPSVSIELTALSVHGSVNRLREILRRFPNTRHAAVSDADAFAREAESLRGEFGRVQFYGGSDGVLEMLRVAHADGADTVLTAVVGAAGIAATMLALDLGLKIALANKETMVTAGPAIAARLRELRTKGQAPAILPVDSEHNAIFQVLHGLRADHLRRVILTASGGPFRGWPLEKIQSARRDEVLNHPTWSMGPKITVDSAGMINKGLELIEAHWLFSVGYDDLDVLVHKDSFVHGMIETTDGGYLLCASRPHMVFPIAHALLFPDPVPLSHDVATRPETWPALAFDEVAPERYPGFALCKGAGQAGGTAPAVLNAANEEAVALFLADRLRFADIPRLIDCVLQQLPVNSGPELEIFLEADRRARELARGSVDRFASL